MNNNDYRIAAEKIRNYFQCSGCILDDKIKTKIINVNPEEKSVTLEFTVNKYALNPIGIMHGGAISWMSDLAMAVAVATYGGEAYGTTADMNIDFLRPIPFGTQATVKGFAVNLGGFLRRARCEFYIENDIVAFACGNYTGKKMLGDFRLGYIDSKTSKIEDGDIRHFILEGSERVLVIDSGASKEKNIKRIAEKLSNLPSIVISTQVSNKKNPKDGAVIELGGRPIEIIRIPEQDSENIAFLDINDRILYLDNTIENQQRLNSIKKRFNAIRSFKGSFESE